MDIRIEQLLHELYALDPVLKEHDKQVRALLVELLRSKPEASLDATFARELKDRLLAVYPHAVTAKPARARFASWFQPVLAYPLAGIAVAVLVVGLIRNSGNPAPAAAPLLKGTVATKSLGAEAFGPISSQPVEGKGGAAADSSQNQASSPSAPAAEPAPIGARSFTVPGGGMGGGVSSIMPVAPTAYRYVYKGDTLDIPQKGVVYRRIGDADQVANIVQGLNLGLIDPNTFSGSKLQFLNLVNEDYQISINFMDGSVNISQNYFGYAEKNSVSKGEVPPDSDIVEIADAFIRDHGISREGYGEPIVQHPQYGPVYATDSMSPEGAYDFATVVYPLVLKDQVAYEMSGTMTGLTVNVDLRTKKVAGIFNLNTQTYETSEYPLETDLQRVKKYLSSQYLDNIEGLRVVEVELGEPETGLVRWYDYQQASDGKGVNRELYIPALLFPVKNRPANMVYPEKVVVPLVKSILDTQLQNQYQPVPLPAAGEPVPKQAL